MPKSGNNLGFIQLRREGLLRSIGDTCNDVMHVVSGLCQDSVAVDYTISASEPEAMADKARQICGKEFRGVVVEQVPNLGVDVVWEKVQKYAVK